jgi:cytochrome c553
MKTKLTIAALVLLLCASCHVIEVKPCENAEPNITQLKIENERLKHNMHTYKWGARIGCWAIGAWIGYGLAKLIRID